MKAYIADTQAVRKNIRIIKNRAGESRVWAVLKGNGYGLGLIKMAEICAQEGINSFAVTEPDDVRSLREAGFKDSDILMLRATSEEGEIEELAAYGAVCTAGSAEDARALDALAQARGIKIKTHIKIDTGMGRYGFRPDELSDILSVYTLPGLDVCGIFTHFHSAFSDEAATRRQFNLFTDTIGKIEAAGYDAGERHCANSSALFKYADMRLDGVRTGSALLGRLAFKNSEGLERVGFCEASIEEIKELRPGESTGYSAAFTAKSPVRAAIVSVGYYHGFGVVRDNGNFSFKTGLRAVFSRLRELFKGKNIYVLVNGKRCRVIGRIGMLHTAVDVTDAECRPGDPVILDINPLMVKGLKIEFR